MGGGCRRAVATFSVGWNRCTVAKKSTQRSQNWAETGVTSRKHTPATIPNAESELGRCCVALRMKQGNR